MLGVLGITAWNKLIMAVAGEKRETFFFHPFFFFLT